MKLWPLIILILAVILAADVEPGDAQGLPQDSSPSKMFGEGFVVNPNARAEQKIPQQPGYPAQVRVPDQSSRGNSETGLQPIQDSSAQESNGKTYDVKAISAVLSAMSSEELKSQLSDLIEISAKHDFALDRIYLRGDFATAMSPGQLIIPLLSRGAEIDFANVPTRYQITKSPAWIIETDQGEIVMEATGPLKDNFNDKGQFVLPEVSPAKGIEEVATPTPAPTETPVELLIQATITSTPSPTPTPKVERVPVSKNDEIESF